MKKRKKSYILNIWMENKTFLSCLLKSGSDSSPVRNLQSFGTEEPAYSTRRVTRSQQQPTPVTPKKYPLRQTRSSGSETEQVVDFSDRGK
jgi:histone acetyltransferase MYST2